MATKTAPRHLNVLYQDPELDMQAIEKGKLTAVQTLEIWQWIRGQVRKDAIFKQAESFMLAHQSGLFYL